MKTVRLVLFLLIVSSVSFVSCRKIDQKESSLPADNKTLKDCQVDPGFSWETTRSLDVRFTSAHSGVVYIRPIEGDFVYHKGFMTKGVQYRTKITIPAYVDKVKLSLNGNIIQVALSGTSLNYAFN